MKIFNLKKKLHLAYILHALVSVVNIHPPYDDTLLHAVSTVFKLIIESINNYI